MKVQVINFSDHGLPRYQTLGSAGCDLRANITEQLTLRPGQRVSLPTGLFLGIPEGYEGQIRPRSGLALKAGITVCNAPGTIDSDYRDEVKVILINLSEGAYTINPGDRIAQLVFNKVEQAEWEEVAELPETNRDGGFGSTGDNEDYDENVIE